MLVNALARSGRSGPLNPYLRQVWFADIISSLDVRFVEFLAGALKRARLAGENGGRAHS
jgi:hypothetical protein